MHEFDLINNFFSKLSNTKGALNLNDDVFFDRSKNLVVSIDTYVQGVHFIDFKNPDLVIKKIIRSSISDLICKGVKPRYYFVSGSGNNRSFTSTNLEKISKSLKQEQNRYNIFLCGGDTVFSNKLSFTVTSIGFSKKIIYRNKAKLNDDIYVTGNLGDSSVGLRILKKKIRLNRSLEKYFVSKYYQPEIHLELSKKLLSFANTSIDISDGLIADMIKLINKQKLSYKINIDKIPVSKKLDKLINFKTLKKKFCVFQGDDYQVLFTASPSKFRIINKTAKSIGVKISKIGKICSSLLKSEIYDQKGMKISLKNQGYYHKF